MAYQYPPPPPPPQGGEIVIPHPDYVLSDGTLPPSHAFPLDARASQDSMFKPRKDSLPHSGQHAKSSMSAQLFGAQQSASTHHTHISQAGEKKRTKLGYHRTSVACGHCRRRKIRCIPALQETSGRCANCIRLKKECSFFPVDQQPMSDAGSKTTSRASTGPKASSGSSSPATSSGQLSEEMASHHHSQVIVPSTQHMAPPPSGIGSAAPEGFISETKMSMGGTAAPRQFDFSGQGVPGWMPAEDGPASTTKSGDMGTTWRPYSNHESPATPSFSPYTSHALPPAATWGTPGSENSHRDDSSWVPYAPAPPRSASYASDTHASPHYTLLSQDTRQSIRKPNDVSPQGYSAIPTPMSGVVGVSAAGLEQSLAVAGPPIPSQGYGSWQQQQYQYNRPPDGYAGWAYGDQGAHGAIHPQAQLSAPGEPPSQPVGMFYPGR